MFIENYLYGEEKFDLPDHLNGGIYVLGKCKQYGDRSAITDTTTGASLSFSEVWRLAVRVALALARLGLAPGDVAAVCYEGLEYYPTLIGIICAGGAYTTIETSGRAVILHKLNLVKPKVMFVSEKVYKTYKDDLKSLESIQYLIVFSDENQDGAILYNNFIELDKVENIESFSPVPIDGNSQAAGIHFSSGTTGLPKAVPWTHYTFLTEVSVFSESCCREGEKLILVAGFCYSGFMSLCSGMSGFSIWEETAEGVLEIIDKYKISLIIQTPWMYFEIVNYPQLQNYNVNSVKHILSLGMTLKPSLIEILKERFPNLNGIYQWYGCTETGAIAKDAHLATKKPGSIGRFYACIGKFLDLDTGKALGPNQLGEIRVKKDKLPSGYINHDSREFTDEEGFYRTGDLGYYDEDKYVYITDRIKDVIHYGRWKISPHELEAVLLQHPSVAEAAVVGAPDPQYGEVAVAFVRLHEGQQSDPQEILDFVNQQIYARAPLTAVRVIEKLPRGGRCKVDRKELRRILYDESSVLIKS